MTRTQITKNNYLDYLTYHGRSVDSAFKIVQKWGNFRNMPEYANHEGIRIWVEASAMVLELDGAAK
jgi:hypothetical protein